MKIKDIDICWLGHSGFLIIDRNSSKKVYIDPYQINNGDKKADIILITHPHYDHCSIEDIQKIIKSVTIIIGPADIQSKISRLVNAEEIEFKLIDVGQTIEIEGIGIGAVPSYNINKPNHPKSERWLGYLLKVGDIIIYHAGDTDLIPEMEKLNGKVKIALLPVGGSFTMDADEASEAALIIHPELAVPMHYGEIVGTEKDAENFVNLCREKGIRAEILKKE